jgi:hypothetical protein
MEAISPSPMERRTLNAIDSANPFQTKIPPPKRIGGGPVASMPDVEPNEIEKLAESDDHMIDVAVESKVEPKKRGRPFAKKPVVETTQPESQLESETVIFENPIIESHDRNGMPSYRCEFAGRDIFVGLPWYKTSNPVTTQALIAMALDFGKDRIRFDLVMGDAMVYHSRNKIAEKFLETDARWLFMLDDDIIPSIGRAGWYRAWVASARNAQEQPLQRHILHRLIGSGKTLVGGAYFGRQEGGRLMCSNLQLESEARNYTDKVVPVDWVGAGAMLIHRKVFEDMRQKYPELASKYSNTPFNYFQPGEDGAGEDIAFCKRAKACGHQPHVDIGIPLAHVGYKTY